MRINFYGSLADAIGREIELPVASGATIADVRRDLATRFPDAAAILARPAVRACIDDQMVGDDRVVGPGATLSFFPPLSGG